MPYALALSSIFMSHFTFLFLKWISLNRIFAASCDTIRTFPMNSPSPHWFKRKMFPFSLIGHRFENSCAELYNMIKLHTWSVWKMCEWIVRDRTSSLWISIFEKHSMCTVHTLEARFKLQVSTIEQKYGCG